MLKMRYTGFWIVYPLLRCFFTYMFLHTIPAIPVRMIYMETPKENTKTHNGRGENFSLLQIQRAALALFIGSDDLSYKAPFGSVLVEAKGGLEVGWKLTHD